MSHTVKFSIFAVRPLQFMLADISEYDGRMERSISLYCHFRRPGLRVLPSPLLKRRSMGFTLIETMIVVAIVAILGSIAAPSFQEMIRKNRLTAASSALQVSLNLARSEAVKRGTDARVTVAANGSVGNWVGGWTVFVDGTNNANAALAPSADSAPSCTTNCVTRLEVVAAPNGSMSFAQTGTLNYFTYNGQGRLIDVSGAGVVNRSAWFSDASSEKYCLIINNTGRVRTARVAGSATCASTGS